jgi:bacterial polymer biosynthesis proteins, WecB/TagA/CpsF family
MSKTNVLGVKIDKITMNETIDKAWGFMSDAEHFHYIFTPNSEIVMEAKSNEDLKNKLNSADLCIADGIGVVHASKILKDPVPERVAGFDLACELLAKMNETEKTAYFFGSAPGVCEAAIENLHVKYPKLKVAGFRNGYFTKEEEAGIVADINEKNPNILLVCLGFPKQENFIFEYKDKLKVSLALGVGGTLDVLAGKAERAPEFFINHGLEWLYRLLKEPKRAFRMIALPKFGLFVLFRGKKYSK